MTGVAAMCADHPDREAKGGVCARCGNFLCAECARAGHGTVYCPRCAAKIALGGKVTQLPWLGGFLIAHGVLTLLASLFFVFYTVFFSVLDDEVFDGAGTPPPGAGMELIAALYGFMALLHVVPGVMQLIAARNVFKRKNRIFVFVALGSTVLTLLPGCCAPTAIALLIYGLIVLLDHAVAGAFDRPSDGGWGSAPSERTEVS